MSDHVMTLANAVTGLPLIAFVAGYAVFPYTVLWLAVRLWPKGHPRRTEYLAEYDAVPWYFRPLWVGDVATRCLLNGLEERWRLDRHRVQWRRYGFSRTARTAFERLDEAVFEHLAAFARRAGRFGVVFLLAALTAALRAAYEDNAPVLVTVASYGFGAMAGIVVLLDLTIMARGHTSCPTRVKERPHRLGHGDDAGHDPS